MIECRLAAGILKISFETMRVCARCAHMTSSGGHPCRACGHTVSRAHATRHLVVECDRAAALLDVAHLYALHRRAPLHLRSIAGNTPARLILSRTRDHGIALDPLGLPDFIDHGGLRLLYALHGHVPYERVADLHDRDEAYPLAAETRPAFETWFLPLFALREKNGKGDTNWIGRKTALAAALGAGIRVPP